MSYKLLILIFALCITGCNVSPFSPKNKINARDVEELKNNSNGIMAEIGKIKLDNQNQNSILKDVQQGLINNKFNENNGFQLLQGDGPLIMLFGIAVIGMLLIYMYSIIEKERKVNQILTKEIKNFNSNLLKNNIIKGAEYTSVENDIKSLFRN